MKTRSYVVILLILLAACQAAPGGTEEQPHRTATFQEIINDVQSRQSEDADYAPAVLEQTLPVGGQAQTGETGRARLDLMPDATLVRLGPSTQFTLSELFLDDDEPLTRLELVAGQVWVILTGGELQVDTDLGSASVRGSYMSVSYDPQAMVMTVTCLEGECYLANDAGTTPLTGGQSSEITAAGQPPSDARPMTGEEYDQWRENCPEAGEDLLPPPIPTASLVDEPARVEFQASDGQTLVGYFHPSHLPDAPVVVLMHMVGYTQQDWVSLGLVDWLQNWPSLQGGASHAAVSSIYPPMPTGLSFAVLTFDYRGFGESAPPFLPDNLTSSQMGTWIEGWLLDSAAAYEIAATMPGVDPERVAGIGASIGADGVVDACGAGCLGALSLSPGSYLNVPYPGAVAQVDAAGKPVWCVAHILDSYSVSACDASIGTYFRPVIFTEGGGQRGAHGMTFLDPATAPPGIGQLILDWLLVIFPSTR
ncbi:MAG: hypothetical protein FJZ96_06090 [Chloroflexi bacterium]|nr:hypothetical protein [Chloroflexota bacterium]